MRYTGYEIISLEKLLYYTRMIIVLHPRKMIVILYFKVNEQKLYSLLTVSLHKMGKFVDAISLTFI